MPELIASAMAPVFFIMLLGYAAGKTKIIDNLNIASLNTFVMWFALPAAMFAAIVRMKRTGVEANALMVLVLAICFLTVYVGMLFLQTRYFKLPLGYAAVQSLTVASPNFAAFGPPFLRSVFGDEGMLAVAIAISTGTITLTPMTLTLLDLDRAGQQHGSILAQFLTAMRRSALKPIVLAPVAAVILVLCDLGPAAQWSESEGEGEGNDKNNVPYAWVIIGGTLDPLAAAASGAALFLTGLILSALPHTVNRNVVASVLVCNLVRPLFMLAIVLLMMPRGQPAGAQALLLMSIPAGIFGVVFGSAYGVRPQVAGSTLVISSLFSIATLTAAVYVAKELATR